VYTWEVLRARSNHFNTPAWPTLGKGQGQSHSQRTGRAQDDKLIQ
jgi:hypothetical protein